MLFLEDIFFPFSFLAILQLFFFLSFSSGWEESNMLRCDTLGCIKHATSYTELWHALDWCSETWQFSSIWWICCHWGKKCSDAFIIEYMLQLINMHTIMCIVACTCVICMIGVNKAKFCAWNFYIYVTSRIPRRVASDSAIVKPHLSVLPAHFSYFQGSSFSCNEVNSGPTSLHCRADWLSTVSDRSFSGSHSCTKMTRNDLMYMKVTDRHTEKLKLNISGSIYPQLIPKTPLPWERSTLLFDIIGCRMTEAKCGQWSVLYHSVKESWQRLKRTWQKQN